MRAVAIGLCVACGAPSAPPANRAVTPETMADARAFARGVGVTRDFAHAAAIYERRCANGEGELAACELLYRAIGHARGVTYDRARMLQLAKTACRHDPIMCVNAMVLEPPQGAAIDEAGQAMSQVAKACQAGDPRSCAVEIRLVRGDELTDIGRRTWFARTACGGDIVDGCAYITVEAGACEDTDAPIGPCVDAVIASWTERRDTRALDGLARLRADCAAGDVDACAASPGQRLSAKELCAAHDYSACAELGCAGDAAAAREGAAHAAEVDCDRARDHASVVSRRAAAPP